jgi:hypothetical protein
MWRAWFDYLLDFNEHDEKETEENRFRIEWRRRKSLI